MFLKYEHCTSTVVYWSYPASPHQGYPGPECIYHKITCQLHLRVRELTQSISQSSPRSTCKCQQSADDWDLLAPIVIRLMSLQVLELKIGSTKDVRV